MQTQLLEQWIGEELAQNAKLRAQMEDYRNRLPAATPEERELLNIAISGCIAALNALDEKIGRAIVGIYRSR